jgi:hypothetical protein
VHFVRGLNHADKWCRLPLLRPPKLVNTCQRRKTQKTVYFKEFVYRCVYTHFPTSGTSTSHSTVLRFFASCGSKRRRRRHCETRDYENFKRKTGYCSPIFTPYCTFLLDKRSHRTPFQKSATAHFDVSAFLKFWIDAHALVDRHFRFNHPISR